MTSSGRTKASPTGDPKRRAMNAYRMPNRYYSQRIGGWKFLLLDTFHADGCRIDARSFSGSSASSRATGPVALVSHAPILTVTGFLESKVYSKGNYVMPDDWIVADVDKLKDLFLRYPRVKLALSGHMHQVDRVEYQGVNYICGGAVSGNWWAAASTSASALPM